MDRRNALSSLFTLCLAPLIPLGLWRPRKVRYEVDYSASFEQAVIIAANGILAKGWNFVDDGEWRNSCTIGEINSSYVHEKAPMPEEEYRYREQNGVRTFTVGVSGSYDEILVKCHLLGRGAARAFLEDFRGKSRRSRGSQLNVTFLNGNQFPHVGFCEIGKDCQIILHVYHEYGIS